MGVFSMFARKFSYRNPGSDRAHRRPRYRCDLSSTVIVGQISPCSIYTVVGQEMRNQQNLLTTVARLAVWPRFMQGIRNLADHIRTLRRPTTIGCGSETALRLCLEEALARASGRPVSTTPGTRKVFMTCLATCVPQQILPWATEESPLRCWHWYRLVYVEDEDTTASESGGCCP